MENKNLVALKVYVLIILLLNLFILGRQLDITRLVQTNPSLDYTKEFANELVANIGGLAADLGVQERSVVRYALAQLHYDILLASNRAELARIVQTNASLTRELIINEFVKTTGEQVLLILNNSGELQQQSSGFITVAPLADGGMHPSNSSSLSQETLNSLLRLPTLFSYESFRPYYAVLRAQTTFELEIDGGVAKLVSTQRDQETINYWEKEIQSLRAQYNQTARGAGLAEISGRGVVIRVYDGIYVLNAVDLRHIVNELFSVGATAMSIGGVRVGIASHIMETPAGIEVDGQVIRTNPVTISVLGEPNTLISGIGLLFNVVFRSGYGFESDPRDSITIPAKTTQ